MLLLWSRCDAANAVVIHVLQRVERMLLLLLLLLWLLLGRLREAWCLLWLRKVLLLLLR